jgi:hypothetical protein
MESQRKVERIAAQTSFARAPEWIAARGVLRILHRGFAPHFGV